MVAANGKASQKNLTAFFSKRTVTEPLTVHGVYSSMWKIAGIHGANSSNLKE